MPKFEISWHDDFGYRVSVPNLLKSGERLLVMPVAEHEAILAEIDARATHFHEEVMRRLAAINANLERL